MGYMANELAVKVKVNLDTSATKLKDDLKYLESNLQKNPIKIAVKIDKKSLTDSLKDAFGKEAADSIKKNLLVLKDIIFFHMVIRT